MGTLGDEVGGEAVEQVGVRGPFAVDAEVVGGGDQPDAEVPLPDPVDDDPGPQGILRVGEPPGEVRPAPGVGGIGRDLDVGRISLHGREPAGGDEFALAVDVAARQDVRRRRVRDHGGISLVECPEILAAGTQLRKGPVVGLPAGLLVRGHLRQQGRQRDPVEARPERRGDLLGRQGLVVDPGLLDLAREVAVAGVGMPQADQDAGVARVPDAEGLPVHPVGAVGLAVPVEADLAVLVGDDRHVHERRGGGGFVLAADVLRADEEVAAEHPAPGDSLAVDDRIEVSTVVRDQRDHPGTLLLERVELDPGFERLGPEILAERRGHEVARLAVEYEAAVLDPRLPNQGSAGLAVLESPGPERDRQALGGLTRLDAGAGLAVEPGDERLGVGDLALQLPDLGVAGDAFGLAQGRAVAVADSLEGGLEPVIVALGDRVELVVVAPGAVGRDPEEGLGDGPDHVLQLVLADPLLHRLGLLGVPRLVPGAVHQEPREGDRFPRDGLQHVAGHLLLDQPGVGDVAVQAGNHGVAVAPGVVAEAIIFESVALGVPRGVQPVPGPALAVLGLRQEPIDQPIVGVRPGILHERLDRLGRGGKAVEVEREATDQGPAVGLRGGLEAPGFKVRQHVGVDRVPDPVGVLDIRRLGLLQGLPGPAVVLIRGDGLDRAGPGRAGVDPALEGLGLGFGQGLLGGHLAGGDSFVEGALVGLAGDEGGPGLAPLDGGGAAGEVEAPLGFGAAVAGDAGAQDRPDFAIEVLRKNCGNKANWAKKWQ